MKKPVALVILDGFGYSTNTHTNAIAHARTTVMTNWFAHFPHALLDASGTSVGLLPDMPGNSLVGHTTMGAGRVVPQPIATLVNAAHDGTLLKNQMLIEHFQQLHQSGGTLHLIGLLSDGASHSHTAYVHALIRLAHQQGIKKIVLHAFLDGRDALPQSAAEYLQKIEALFNELGVGTIGSMCGRAGAMDRNNRDELVQQTFTVLTQPQAIQYNSWQDAINDYYSHHITDEFIPPTQLVPDSYVHNADGIIFFNIRADRARELVRLFLHDTRLEPAWIITGVPYFADEPAMSTIPTLFTPQPPNNTLLDILEAAGKTIFTIAEQEKYAHVTYFFSGGKETMRSNETRTIIPSYPQETLAEHPCMSAPAITNAVLASLHKNPADFYLINYANADMVGHTGNFDATVKAIQCLDEQLQRLYEQIVDHMAGTLIITADHGKAEQMGDPATGKPQTAHTTNPVPLIVIKRNLRSEQAQTLPLTTLADVAPYILSLMHLPIPDSMGRTTWSKT